MDRPSNSNITAVGNDKTHHHVESRRFTSTVGAEKTDNFARFNGEIYALDDLTGTVGFSSVRVQPECECACERGRRVRLPWGYSPLV